MKFKFYERVLLKSSLELINELNDEMRKYGFYLSGGSGLSIQIGHRISEDLDFFTKNKFDVEILSLYLEKLGGYKETLILYGTLYCTISNVKVSFIYYDVPLIYPLIKFKKINVANWRDILAEKFKTLSQRGSRKDFYDIYSTIVKKKLTIAESVEIFKMRFINTGINFYHVLKSLVYFNDAENEPDLLLLRDTSWNKVKSFFQKNLKEFEKHLLK